MVYIESFKQDEYILITAACSVYLFNQKNDLSAPIFEYKHEGAESITFSTLLPEKNLVILADTNKKMFIMDASNSKNLLATKNIVKKAAKMLVTKDESTLLISDKTGDVYTFCLENYKDKEVVLLMGHLSVITDLKLTSDENYLITSDRDEKIRISHFKNAYNVKAFLLGHKEFISQIELINDKQLISASGDSKLILWNLNGNFKSIQEINTAEFLKNNSSNEKDFQSKGISQFIFDKESSQLIVHLYNSKNLLVFKYSSEENMFNFESVLEFSENRIDYIARLFNNYYLFISDKKIELKMISIDCKVVDFENGFNIDKNMFAFKVYLNENINLEGARAEIEGVYESYFKNIIYSNVETYYEKKNERIQAYNNHPKALAKRAKLEVKNIENTKNTVA